MAVPLVDLKAHSQQLKQELANAVLSALESTQFINGPAVAAFEGQLAEYTESEHAVGCASGTDALYLALRSLGIGPGSEVITTPFTFVATAEAIARCGATPVFADIDSQTYNIDPENVRTAITSRTRAILPVHLFGQAADMDPLMALARLHGLSVIEDGAQSLGGKYKGRPLGGIGDAGCLSFFPSKTIGGAGDGGAVIVKDAQAAQMVRTIRDHGAVKKYYSETHGLNSRLDTVQAAYLRVKLRHLDAFIQQRNQVARWYDAALQGLPIVRPTVTEGCLHAFGYYTVQVQNRERVQQVLNQHGIGNAVYYPYSLHCQPVFGDLGYKPGDFPVSEHAQEHVLSLPMYPELTQDQVREIADALKKAV
ncbi:MAG: DegT/DnrJ/EryC1/StrS family aminotransferase [Chloroflexi bacterium]|nr:DegT/DnrJ/EryC1/StrS family aminotransferase [Chloroflexota bacterium]